MKSTSPSRKLNKVDYYKSLRSLAVFALGQALIYSAQYVSGLDLGIYTPIVGTVSGMLVELIRRYFVDHTLKQA